MMTHKAQHAILRFAKHKAGLAGALEAHHERTKERYASNPDIDISKSKDNFHIIQPAQKYRKEINIRIKTAGCRLRQSGVFYRQKQAGGTSLFHRSGGLHGEESGSGQHLFCCGTYG